MNAPLPTSPPRVIRPLANILPSDAAVLCEEVFLSWVHEYTRLFEFEKDPKDDPKSQSRFVEMVREIVAYAQGSETDKTTVERAAKNAGLLLAMAQSSFFQRVEPGDPILERINPYASELSVICTAALGRYRLEVEKKDVPDAWFAALMSIKVESLRSYLCREHARLKRTLKSRHLLKCAPALNMIRARDDL
jgi:hypothetical protein